MRLSAASVARAVERDGVVRLDGIFPRPLLKRIAARVMRLYASGGLRERVVRDIAGRTTSILPFDGPFLERSFCANPRLLAIVENLLGGTARWSSLEVVMAESGAAAQYQHVDAPLRLDRKGKRYKGDLSTLPPYALALAVPLVDVDEENGPTAVWPGSHKEGLKYPPPSEAAIRRRYPMKLMTGKLGQAYLYDYRTFHRGMPNRSADPRPLLMLVFCRAWFRDPNLEPVGSGLRLAKKDRARLPARARELFVALALLLAALPSRAETVRILSHNLWGRDKADCAERYKALAAHVLAASPPYDVVALLEDWKVPANISACDPSHLTKAIEAGGTFAGKTRSIRHLPRATDALQIAGGVSIFTRHEIVDAYENRFVNSTDFPLSGFALARVRLASGAEIDVWNAHLEAGSDGCSDDCRWEQATDFGSEVQIMSTPAKGKTGNPVLIMGDLNTGGPMSKAEKPPFAGNGGYGNVMEALESPRDLWLELGAGDGFTYDCSTNKATGGCKYRERIDYMLLPEGRRTLDPKSKNVLVPKKIEVVRWKTPKGDPVSDHYGLDATFELVPRPDAKPGAKAAPKK